MRGAAGRVPLGVVGEAQGESTSGLDGDLALAAAIDAPVLITAGIDARRREIARAIHDRGRRGGPWLTVSCAPEGPSDRPGTRDVDLSSGRASDLTRWFDEATGGTLFLDRVGELSAAGQRDLLALLDAAPTDADGFATRATRVIVGADRHLMAEVWSQQFSAQLFYRLNVIRIDDGAFRPVEDRTMTVGELMSTPAQTCQPDTDLAAVTQMMWHHDCGFVPVVDADGHVAGVITDRDVCVASATRRLLPERIAASQAMSTSVHACLPDDDVERALVTMKQFQIRRLPVVDANGRLQGIVSMNDVVRAVGRKGAPTATAVVATMAAICAPRAVAAAVA